MQTDASKMINYVIWGSKRGTTYFFNSSGIDLRSKEISDTLKDIRPVIRFPEAGKDFYSIEFTSEYKVFTHFRSVFDWDGRPGGNLAVTVYLPHRWKLPSQGVLKLLNRLIDKYWELYVDKFVGTIKRTTNEDVSLFQNIVDSAAMEMLEDKSGKKSGKSEQNEIYGLIRYRDTNLADYFDNPYQREYLEYQEIILLHQSINMQMPGSIKLLAIEPVPNSYTLTLSLNKGITGTITVNGTAKNALAFTSAKIKDGDFVELHFEQPLYASLDFNGTTEELTAKHYVDVDNNRITVTPVLEQTQKYLQFTVQEKGAKNIVRNIRITEKNLGEINANGYTFETGKHYAFTINAPGYYEQTYELTVTKESTEIVVELIPESKNEPELVQETKRLTLIEQKNADVAETSATNSIRFDFVIQTPDGRPAKGITVSFLNEALQTDNSGKVHFDKTMFEITKDGYSNNITCIVNGKKEQVKIETTDIIAQRIQRTFLLQKTGQTKVGNTEKSAIKSVNIVFTLTGGYLAKNTSVSFLNETKQTDNNGNVCFEVNDWDQNCDVKVKVKRKEFIVQLIQVKPELYKAEIDTKQKNKIDSIEEMWGIKKYILWIGLGLSGLALILAVALVVYLNLKQQKSYQLQIISPTGDTLKLNKGFQIDCYSVGINNNDSTKINVIPKNDTVIILNDKDSLYELPVTLRLNTDSVVTLSRNIRKFKLDSLFECSNQLDEFDLNKNDIKEWDTWIKKNKGFIIEERKNDSLLVKAMERRVKTLNGIYDVIIGFEKKGHLKGAKKMDDLFNTIIDDSLLSSYQIGIIDSLLPQKNTTWQKWREDYLLKNDKVFEGSNPKPQTELGKLGVKTTGNSEVTYTQKSKDDIENVKLKDILKR